MEVSTVFTEVEAALHSQLALTDDPDITEAASALMAVLEPSLRQASVALAEQAALEADAQLPDHQVSLVLAHGDPQLQVQSRELEPETTAGANEARLTVRLPEELKLRLEAAALDTGQSVNSYVVNALSSKARHVKPSRGNRIRTSIDL